MMMMNAMPMRVSQENSTTIYLLWPYTFEDTLTFSFNGRWEMEMETKEDGSILLDEKSQKMVDVQPLKITDDMINGVIKGQEHEMNKLSAFSDHGDEINIADGNETESDATAKFPHSIDVDFESMA